MLKSSINLKINGSEYELEKYYKEKANNEKLNGNNIKRNAFEQLLELQLLIQKHAGLKELCKIIYKNIIYIFIYNYYSYKRQK